MACGKGLRCISTISSLAARRLCCYRWQHDQVLRKLVEHTESMRVLANRKPQCPQKQLVQFDPARQMEQNSPTHRRTSVLTPGNNWPMRADRDKQLRFPSEITTTTLRPDIVPWSAIERCVLITELTIPWEEGTQEAYERKKLQYGNLFAVCQGKGWRATSYPLEVIAVLCAFKPSASRETLASHHQRPNWSLKILHLIVLV